MKTPTSNTSPRIVSIDVLRGFTILVMIFVNDLSSVQGVPDWMEHAAEGEDRMTFVDWVFPAFLFITGMSIPFAIGRRLERGAQLFEVFKHVLIRTFGLLVMGVYMVNGEEVENRNAYHYFWMLFMYIAIIMVWNVLPKKDDPKYPMAFTAQKYGMVLLVILAFLFIGNGDHGWIDLRPSWWGILGLIGWAYLVASTVYILFRKQPMAIMGMVPVLYIVFMAAQTGFFDWISVIPVYIEIGSMLGSHAAITLSGVILGIILSGSEAQSHTERIRWGVLYGLALYGSGIMLHSLHEIDPMFIVNKILATPTWCLLSSAYTVWVWVLIYWLMDVRGWKSWAAILEPAGQNPLLAYILAPIFYVLFYFTNVDAIYYSLLNDTFAVGLTRAIVFTLAVTWCTGLLYKRGIQLRL